MASAKKARKEMRKTLTQINRAGKEMKLLCINARDRDTKKRACRIMHRLGRLEEELWAEVSISALLK